MLEHLRENSAWIHPNSEFDIHIIQNSEGWSIARGYVTPIVSSVDIEKLRVLPKKGNVTVKLCELTNTYCNGDVYKRAWTSHSE